MPVQDVQKVGQFVEGENARNDEAYRSWTVEIPAISHIDEQRVAALQLQREHISWLQNKQSCDCVGKGHVNLTVQRSSSPCMAAANLAIS